MNNQPTAFFFQIQPIPDDTILFDQFQQQNIFYSYFQVEQNYYLFLYSQKFIDIDSIDPFIHIIQELDTKQRKIRSFRGFLLYALEIMEAGKDVEILKTNLQPFFWKKAKASIRQNQKKDLLEVLFGDSYQGSSSNSETREMIQNLQNQVHSLQEKVRNLEIQLKNSKYALRATLDAPDATKILKPGKSTLEGKKGPSLPENYSEVRDSTSRGKDMESKSFSEAKISPLKTLSGSQQYNLSSNQEKDLHGANFITLGKISEEEKIEIIKLGFRLNQEGKISFKDYYESPKEYSLFQLKGYSIKYDTIRKNKFYQQLKPSNN